MVTWSSGTSADKLAVPKAIGLFNGAFCDKCVLRDICGDRQTNAACGDRAEYPSGSIHALDVRDTNWAEHLAIPPPSQVLEVPGLPRSLVIAKTRKVSGVARFGVALEKVFTSSPSNELGSKQVAVLHGRDEHLERIWEQRGRLGQRLKDAGYDSAVSPAFSNYWAWSPVDNLVMVVRGMEVFESMSEVIPTIPTIIARNQLDLERWLEFLLPISPPFVAVHLSPGRQRGLWTWLTKMIGNMAELFGGHAPSLLANGPSTVQRITTISNLWPTEVVFASQMPWQTARSGRLLDAHLKRYKAPTTTSTDELTARNAETFASVVESIVQEGAAIPRFS